MLYYINVNGYYIFYGRVILIVIGVKVFNFEFMVIVEGGDGDMYVEGGNYLFYVIRRNFDIIVFIYDN